MQPVSFVIPVTGMPFDRLLFRIKDHRPGLTMLVYKPYSEPGTSPQSSISCTLGRALAGYTFATGSSPSCSTAAVTVGIPPTA